MNSKRILPAVAAGLVAVVLAAAPSSALGGYVSAWSSSSSTRQVSCGTVNRTQGSSYATVNTGGCNWFTYIRADYFDYSSGRYLTTSWKPSQDSYSGASYVSTPAVTHSHQISY